MNKVGISALVATVLTILITVAGVGIIWVAIVPMINENIAFEGLDGRVSIVTTGGYTVYDADEEVAIVQVKRDVDEGVMNRIKVSFMIDGESVSSNVVAPNSGQTKTYTFDLSDYGEPDGIEVAPIFVSESGKEKEGSVTSKVDVPSGAISEVDADVLELDRDYFYDLPMTGLVSWWKFDDEDDIGKDSVGENDGVNNGVTFDEGVGVFGGDGDYVEIQDSDELDLSDLSISAWFKPKDDNDNYNPIISKDETGGRSWFLQTSGKNNLAFYIRDSDGEDNNHYSGVEPIKDVWYHVVASYKFVSDGFSIMSICVNGEDPVTIDNANGPIATTSSKVHIGEWGTHFFNGSIDNVMIFDRALTEAEIEAIYENQMK